MRTIMLVSLDWKPGCGCFIKFKWEEKPFHPSSWSRLKIGTFIFPSPMNGTKVGKKVWEGFPARGGGV
jgi:hypothetical protein